MAGGKLSARQKMINLMYLVFIAMLALQIDREVLSSFGLFNDRFTEANAKLTTQNAKSLADLQKAAIVDEKEEYKQLYQVAQDVKNASDKLYNELQAEKDSLLIDLEDKTDFVGMKKTDKTDEKWFTGDRYTKEGQAFVNKISTYRSSIASALGTDNPLVATVNTKFKTDSVTNTNKKKEPWLSYNFKGYPMAATIAKLTQMQNDVKITESEVLNELLKGQLKSEVSIDRYLSLMEQPKSAYYTGETFDGSIVLGRKDDTFKPKRVELTLDGRPLSKNDYEILEGKVKLKVAAGRAGDHKISGKLIFGEEGKEKEVEVEQSFAVIPKPNSATISADKMNVVYRGVENPMTISFAGIPDNKVTASGTGLSKASGTGKYVMRPGSGTEVTIRVNGKLPDGKPVNDQATFRIKNVPPPTGKVLGESGSFKMSKAALANGTVNAELDDFDFKLPIRVTEFKFKVPGQPTIRVSGTKLDARAKNALKRAKRGQTVQFFDIKAKSSVPLKKISPVIVEITN